MTDTPYVDAELANAINAATDCLPDTRLNAPELHELWAFARSVRQPVRWLAYTSGTSVLADTGLRPLFVRQPDGRVLEPADGNMPRDLNLAWDEGFQGRHAHDVVFRWAIAARQGLKSSIRSIRPRNETIVNGGHMRACIGEFLTDQPH